MKCLFYLFALFMATVFCNTINTTLKTVHVVFRHGMRYPKLLELYPTDPFLNYFTNGKYGQLTENGKKGSYRLGKFLRKRYNDFIGTNYQSDQIFAKSTPSDRTLMTARLVLAGLYEKPVQQILNDTSNLNPLPFFISTGELDVPLYDDLNGTKYANEYEQVLLSNDYNNTKLRYKDVFNYISKNSGKSISSFKDVNAIYHALCAEEHLNFTLPKWTESVYPDQIHNLAATWLNFANYNSALKRLNGGKVLRSILDEIESTINNDFNGYNFYLYSGHDRTIVSILTALNMYDLHIPKYNSALLIELHQVEKLKAYILKIFYVRDSRFDLEELLVTGCKNFCELEGFKQLFKNHIPETCS